MALLVVACDNTIVQTLSPPQITISTDKIDFGEVPVGSTVTRKLTVQNIGQQPLDLAGTSISALSPRTVLLAARTALHASPLWSPAV